MNSVVGRPKIAVVTVTHNDQRVMGRYIEALGAQSRQADQVILLDSGSTDPAYVRHLAERPRVLAIYQPTDVGFCRGNNLAVEGIFDQFVYILFLNPDAFLHKDFLAGAEAFMQRPENAKVGILTGTLLGYSIAEDRPTGLYDCTGIGRNWYGRWYTRDQGSPIRPEAPSRQPEEIPAICGALMFCRSQALRDSLLRGREVFDEQFFMWKDDIDLSLRVRRAGWKLAYLPSLESYHCRGWNRDRKRMPKLHRVLAARNDVRIYARNRSPFILYAAAKYLFVRFVERA